MAGCPQESAAPALIPATGTCLCSPTLARVFTPGTHVVLLPGTGGRTPALLQGCCSPSLAGRVLWPWHRELWTRPGELVPFSRNSSGPPSKSPAAHHCFYPLVPHPRGCGTGGCPVAEPPEWALLSRANSQLQTKWY